MGRSEQDGEWKEPHDQGARPRRLWPLDTTQAIARGIGTIAPPVIASGVRQEWLLSPFVGSAATDLPGKARRG
ncbi:hypothetical protein Q7W82_17635 [Xanthomonas indica]|uniref:Uncharacterized protein n=2 Tax=Xanthomonas indica TaxID=2912242 RepID=A0AAU8I3V3_9XANT|nr:hypothetical protein [Xanthomonas indica]